MSFVSINILDLLNEEDDDARIKSIISSFSCPLNSEIESFLKNNSINFAKQKIAISFLVFLEETGELLGYYTLTNKAITIGKNALSCDYKRKLKRYFKEDENGEFYGPCYLIAQLGKNASLSKNTISGDDLLNDAYSHLIDAQRIIGGGFVFLECENKPELMKFYSDYGFKELDERQSEEGILYKRLIIRLEDKPNEINADR